jgi:hypothetical protein
MSHATTGFTSKSEFWHLIVLKDGPIKQQMVCGLNPFEKRLIDRCAAGNDQRFSSFGPNFNATSKSKITRLNA